VEQSCSPKGGGQGAERDEKGPGTDLPFKDMPTSGTKKRWVFLNSQAIRNPTLVNLCCQLGTKPSAHGPVGDISYSNVTNTN
jgi:hypothetical protein